ncbi:MAG: hypothetical protein AABY32_05540 [Nanoarchaeota archaeon]
MKDYFDNELKEIKKGFYKLPDSDDLFYFTGKYEAGFAIFEKESEAGKSRLIPHTKVHNLSQVNREFVERELGNLKNKTNWLEEKLKE